MKNHCELESSEIWQKAAHRLKGSAANLGALKLSEVCAMAEEASAQRPEEKARLLVIVEENYHNVRMLVTK